MHDAIVSLMSVLRPTDAELPETLGSHRVAVNKKYDLPVKLHTIIKVQGRPPPQGGWQPAPAMIIDHWAGLNVTTSTNYDF
jgi:hypothetical protein